VGPATCTDCISGKFSTRFAMIQDSCQSCPLNSNAPPATQSRLDCFCNAGSTGFNGDVCTKCTPGKYKIITGSDNCQLCNKGKYSTADGATSDVCIRCPEYSSAPTASVMVTDCTCEPGSTGVDGSNCTLCVAGTYKSVTGDALCSSCASGMYSEHVGAISDMCTACPDNSNPALGSDGLVDCICDAGWTKAIDETGACTQCVSCKYKQLRGNVLCDLCTEGKYSTTTGAISIDACKTCPAASDAPQASSSMSNCKCAIGWMHHDNNTHCKQCERDTYTNAVGSDTCMQCTPTQYSIVTYGTAVQYSDDGDHINVTKWPMCSVQKIALSTGINTNVRFQVQRESPCTVRFLLGSANNWTVGDTVSIQYGEDTTLNPVVLQCVDTQPGKLGPIPLWSPVNVQPMHQANSVYTITVQVGPLLLKLDS